jgi:hypothetical protein
MMRTGGHWNASYRGRPEHEYIWFAMMSSLPIVSADVARSARIIVDGVTRGKRRIIFTPMARMSARISGLAPELTTRMLGLMGRYLLPSDSDEELRGWQAAGRVKSRMFNQISTLGRRAVRRWNQLDPAQSHED